MACLSPEDTRRMETALAVVQEIKEATPQTFPESQTAHAACQYVVEMLQLFLRINAIATLVKEDQR